VAPNVQQSIGVHYALQTISFAPLPAALLTNGPVSLFANASSGLPITFASLTPSNCIVTGSTVTPLAAGTCTISAIQAGNNQYYGPVSYNRNLIITLLPQTINFSALPEQTYGAAPFLVNATASSGLPANFSTTTPSICAASGNQVTLLAGGTCRIVASQTGNNFYAAAPNVQQSFLVHLATQTISFPAIQATPLANGSTTLYATASSGLPVTFASTTPSTCTVSGSTATLLALGTCTISAIQAGNNQYYGPVSYNRNLIITLLPQTINFASLPNQTYGTPAFALNATATSGLPVGFTSATPKVCTLGGNIVTLLLNGTCTIRATQAGNSDYSPAPQMSRTFMVSNLNLSASAISPQVAFAGSPGQTITVTGTGFLPSTTATYAGATHPITYVNATTILLSLSAADLTSTGVKTIVLRNQTPIAESSAINLPILSVTDVMLSRSQLAAGDQARLQNLIQKGRNGNPVTIVALGGSITQGYLASDNAHSYAGLLQTWWNQTFPSSVSTLVNAGINGTGSDYGSLRAQRDVLAYNPDLVIVEFAVTDRNQFLGDAYEGLLRQLLDAPSQPAVIVLFMTTHQLPVVQSAMTAESWQSAIGANYDLPMVSYFQAISPELTNGHLTINQLTPDGTNPNDLGHAYAAQFIEQNLQIAINNFLPGTTPNVTSPTQPAMYSTDFEFTSLQEGIGTWGTPLNPINNQGWTPVSVAPGGTPIFPDAGLEGSTPGSTIDFSVVGREILLGYYQIAGPMGQVRVSVDGGAAITLDGFYPSPIGNHVMSRLASGLQFGPHQVHIQLLGTKNSGSTGTTFDVLSIGAGGEQQ
jgi:lysophospholipase L1-like esterase